MLGLAVGSFLNVVIYRVPNGESLLTPPSHCPKCNTPIRNRHNVPLFGWLVLRGRCADCGAPISIRYPLVELVTGILFVAVALRLNSLDLLPALPAYLYLTSIGIALTMIDIDVRRLPDSIVLPSYLVLAASFAIAAAISGDWGALTRSALGGSALYGFFYALAFAYPAGMGFGDVKLAGILGAGMAYVSWPTLLIGAFAAFLLGGFVGAVLIVTRRGSAKTAIPFGPYMIVGAGIAISAANPIWHFYISNTLGS